MSARDSLARNKVGKIAFLVQLKQEVGDDTKIRASQLQGLSREQILKFIDDHPGSAKFFHESLFSRELARAMAKLKSEQRPLAIAGRVAQRGGLQDFEPYVLSCYLLDHFSRLHLLCCVELCFGLRSH